MGKQKRNRSAEVRARGLQRYRHKFKEVNGDGLATVRPDQAVSAATFCIEVLGKKEICAASLDFRIVSRLSCGTMPPTAQNSERVIALATQRGWDPNGAVS